MAVHHPMDMVAAPPLRQQVLCPRAASSLVQAVADVQEEVSWEAAEEALPEGEECHSLRSHYFLGARPQRQWRSCPFPRLADTARVRAREPSVGLHGHLDCLLARRALMVAWFARWAESFDEAREVEAERPLRVVEWVGGPVQKSCEEIADCEVLSGCLSRNRTTVCQSTSGSTVCLVRAAMCLEYPPEVLLRAERANCTCPVRARAPRSNAQISAWPG